MKFFTVTLFTLVVAATTFAAPTNPEIPENSDIDLGIDIECIRHAMSDVVESNYDDKLNNLWKKVDHKLVLDEEHLQVCHDLRETILQRECIRDVTFDAIFAMQGFYDSLADVGRTDIIKIMQDKVDDECPAEREDDIEDSEFGSSNHTEKLKCVLGVVKEVCEREGGQLKKVWDDAKQVINKIDAELKKCLKLPDADDRKKCFQEKFRELSQTVHKLFSDIRKINEDAANEIRTQIREKCKKIRTLIEEDFKLFKDEDFDTHEYGVQIYSEHVKCILGVVKEVCQKNGPQVKKLWAEAKENIDKTVAELKKCRELPNKPDRAKCAREKSQQLRQIVGKLIEDIRAVKVEAVQDILRLVSERCKKIYDEDIELFEVDESQPMGNFFERVKCIVDGINEITQKHDSTIDQLWNKTKPQLHEQLQKLKGCSADPSSARTCVREVALTTHILVREFTQSVRKENKQAFDEIRQKVRQCILGGIFEISEEKDENIIDEYGVQDNSEHVKCVLGIVKEVFQKNGPQVQQLWAEAKQNIEKTAAELKQCRELPNQPDRVKCAREKTEQLRQITRKLIKDLLAVKVEAVKEIRKQVAEKCKPNNFEDDLEFFELDEVAPISIFAEKVKCIVKAINEISAKHDATVGQLWNKTKPQLKNQVEKLKTCPNESDPRECVLNVLDTSRTLVREFLTAVQRENQKAHAEIRQKVRQCIRGESFELFEDEYFALEEKRVKCIIDVVNKVCENNGPKTQKLWAEAKPNVDKTVAELNKCRELTSSSERDKCSKEQSKELRKIGYKLIKNISKAKRGAAKEIIKQVKKVCLNGSTKKTTAPPPPPQFDIFGLEEIPLSAVGDKLKCIIASIAEVTEKYNKELILLWELTHEKLNDQLKRLKSCRNLRCLLSVAYYSNVALNEFTSAVREQNQAAYKEIIKCAIGCVLGNGELFEIEDLDTFSSAAEKLQCIKAALNSVAENHQVTIGELWEETQPKLQEQLTKLQACRENPSTIKECVAKVLEDGRAILKQFIAEVQKVNHQAVTEIRVEVRKCFTGSF